MKIYSWNVNGIRAIIKKGFFEWFSSIDADIVCLQEPKALEDKLSDDIKEIAGFKLYYHNGTRAGYAGTSIYSKQEALGINYTFCNLPDIYAPDGRIIELEFERFHLLNIYFPNGGAKADGTEMLSYKLLFYKAFLEHIEKLKKKGKSIIICGDFNIVHTRIDIARPDQNEHSIGFTKEERAWISRLVEHDYVDIWRHKNPNKKDTYSWWSYVTRARERNIGWRIDYFFITKDLVDKVKDVDYCSSVMGSDHCPMYLDIDL